MYFANVAEPHSIEFKDYEFKSESKDLFKLLQHTKCTHNKAIESWTSYLE